MRRRAFGWLSLLSAVGLAQVAGAAELPPSTGTGETVPGPAPAQTPAPQMPPSEAAPPAPETAAPAPAMPPPATFEPVAPELVIMVLPPQAPAPPSFKIESGDSSLRIGLLLQPQYLAASSITSNSYSQNLYIRRTRILLGGTLFGTFDYFLDTDYPNLFFANNVTGAGGAETSVKATPGMNIQDAFATWRAVNDYFKVDVGYMLPPLAHNAVQGATTLYSWDYFNYTFQHNLNGVFQTSASAVGRDTGVQARGLLVDGHVEYRVGLFQGRRNNPTTSDVGARNFFRLAGRLQINLLDPETGFFYQGTYLGAKKILSVGGSIDWQDTYHYYAGDVFLDLPFGPIGVLTAQGNFAYWNGGSFIPEMIKQKAVMAEGGFLFAMVHLGPVLRFEHLWGSGTAAVPATYVPDQTRYVGGLAFWPYGHNSNVKAFYTRFQEKGAPHGSNAFAVQWQLFFY